MRVAGPDEDHVLEHRRLRGFHANDCRGSQREADPALNWCCRGPSATSDVKVELSSNVCPTNIATSEKRLSCNNTMKSLRFIDFNSHRLAAGENETSTGSQNSTPAARHAEVGTRRVLGL